ncbi:MAG TPA: thioredoxin family protein [bacterium]|nr:thioredoxin family protein [bacterium]
MNVDENSGIANRYGIMSIPTLAIFKGGEMVERLVGYMPKPELKRRLERTLGATVS